MFNKKLISLRLDSQVLARIDEFAKNAHYYNRTDVISHLLRQAVDAAIWENGKVKNTEKSLWHLKFTADWSNR